MRRQVYIVRCNHQSRSSTFRRAVRHWRSVHRLDNIPHRHTNKGCKPESRPKSGKPGAYPGTHR